MSPAGSSSLSFPAFRGITRQLILINVFAYFVLLVLRLTASDFGDALFGALGFTPSLFFHGFIWQPITYSFIHAPGAPIATAFQLISLWFMAGFLEQYHPPSWVLGLYSASVLGAALAASIIFAGHHAIGYELPEIALFGCFSGIFGMLIAVGILYGELEFLLFLTIPIKARYIAVIYGLVAIAFLFGAMRMYAFSLLGGAFAGWIFLRLAPRRGLAYSFSESWYGMRNRYYRWKRRRAARKFEVYMRSQGRTVKFDGNGKQIDDDANDKKRWN